MSEWRDHPDWLNKADYDFLKNASPDVWAWEFLRRNKLYVADWQRIENLKQEFGKHWGKAPGASMSLLHDRRDVYDRQKISIGGNPHDIRLDGYMALQWGISVFADPSAPMPSTGFFLKPDELFPRRLRSADEMITFATPEYDPDDEDEGPPRFSAFVFDNLLPITKQLKLLKTMLAADRKAIQKVEKLKHLPAHAGKGQKWLRHLRSLDALRCAPPPTAAEIGRKLCDPSISPASAEKQGPVFVEQAETMADAGFRTAHLLNRVPY